MPRKYPSDVSLGSVVLAEVALYRWKTSEVKYTWSTWSVAFELQALSVLAAPPPGTHVDRDEFEFTESDVRF